MIRNLLFTVLFVGFLGGCASTAPSWAPGGGMPRSVPAPTAEFRAAWLATVANIDWPSSPDLSTLQQQQELRTMMDRAVEIGLNAIVLQVRPTADAFYASPLEPWSYYLTGVQGRAPEPFYDPLAFAVEEAHRRGLELHAWFNPYRVLHPTATDSISALHASKRLPGSVVTYGDLMWFEPGSDEATAQSMAVIMDVVERYDVDGVHLDDYFYPYPVSDEDGAHVEFPDEANWRADSTDGLARDDWRRRNVDVFIQNLYEGVKARKPWVKVGISPFGIWRPGHPPTVRGFDQYAGLYADARKWLNEGWIDYWTPQLYWSMDSEGQSYAALLDWWVAENHHDRHMWPGLYTSRVILEGTAWWEPAEIVRQIEHTQRTEGAAGNVHFSMRALMPAAHGMGEAVAAAYDEAAIVPASPWLGGQAPAAPALTAERGYVAVRPAGREPVFVWAVHWWDGRNWHFERVPGWQQSLRPPAEGVRGVAVRAVSRLGHVSSPATLTF